MKGFIILLIFIETMQVAFAKHEFTEKQYQKQWCEINQGITEFKNPDGTRVDCLTKEYAVEFDFASKWAESIGQALYYSELTGLNAGIVLILEKPIQDLRYYYRAKVLSDKYNIKLWLMVPDELRKNYSKLDL